MIYLDNSATSYPKPKEVYETYKNAIKYYFSNPGRGGYENSLLSAEKIFETREKVAAFFGEENAENVVFTANCTTSINMVLKGLLEPGDHVLTSDMEHNAVMRVLEKLKRESSIKYDKFHVDFYDESNTLCSLKKAICPQTKLVICTHASNVTGVCLPLQEIGEICKRYHIFFAVDAAQSGGILPIDVRKQHIDFLCLAPHKGLLAPMGSGILIGDGALLRSLIEGGTGSRSADMLQPAFMPDRLESGTANVSGIICIGAGIDYINKQGRESILRHERECVLSLHRALSACDKTVLYADYDKLRQFAPVFSFNIANIPSEEVSQLLAQRHICSRAGLHCAPATHLKIGTIDTGTVRLSPSYFTTNKDINYTISTIKNLVLNF